MLFFLKRWWLKKKKFPNRRTVLASAWSERCGVTSRRFWPAVYWKISDPMFFFTRARIIHVDVQCLPSREKREMLEYCRSRERGTSWSRKLSSLRPRIRFFFFSFFFFFLKGLVSGAIKCSQQIQFLAHWLAPRLVFSWTSKLREWRYSVERRTDGMMERNGGIHGIFLNMESWNTLKRRIRDKSFKKQSTPTTRTLATDSNLVLTRSNTNFCFSSDHFYIILPSITRTMF